MSGLTSQPSMGAICMALEQTQLGTGIRYEDIQALNLYWSQVRMLYSCFEANVRASDSSVFDHEMPGGQYTNLMVRVDWQTVSTFNRSFNSSKLRSWVLGHSGPVCNKKPLIFLIPTFLAVIKQKYIEANELVSFSYVNDRILLPLTILPSAVT